MKGMFRQALLNMTRQQVIVDTLQPGVEQMIVVPAGDRFDEPPSASGFSCGTKISVRHAIAEKQSRFERRDGSGH